MAIAMADVHWSLTAPVCRKEKKDWLKVQTQVMMEVSTLQMTVGGCPVLIAGDLFNRWDSSAHLINMVLSHAPLDMYGIPGNHDLPNHSYRELPRTAYWTLVEAGRLKTLTPPGPLSVGHMSIHPFPCGFDLQPATQNNGLALNIALVHDYVWTEKTGYEGAPKSKRYGKQLKLLKGYDIAIFGDNHKGFLLVKDGQCTVFNVGTLMRRKTDEIQYTPCVGKIYGDGRVVRHYLDVSRDQFTEIGKDVADIESTLEVDLSGFVEEMVEMRARGANWQSLVQLWIKSNNLTNDVKEIIIRCISEQP